MAESWCSGPLPAVFPGPIPSLLRDSDFAGAESGLFSGRNPLLGSELDSRARFRLSWPDSVFRTLFAIFLLSPGPAFAHFWTTFATFRHFYQRSGPPFGPAFAIFLLKTRIYSVDPGLSGQSRPVSDGTLNPSETYLLLTSLVALLPAVKPATREVHLKEGATPDGRPGCRPVWCTGQVCRIAGGCPGVLVVYPGTVLPTLHYPALCTPAHHPLLHVCCYRSWSTGGVGEDSLGSDGPGKPG